MGWGGDGMGHGVYYFWGVWGLESTRSLIFKVNGGTLFFTWYVFVA